MMFTLFMLTNYRRYGVNATQTIQERHTVSISISEIMEEYDLPDTLIPKSARLAIGSPGTVIIEFDSTEYQTLEHKFLDDGIAETEISP